MSGGDRFDGLGVRRSRQVDRFARVVRGEDDEIRHQCARYRRAATRLSPEFREIGFNPIGRRVPPSTLDG
jgi:hypothetical protein